MLVLLVITITLLLILGIIIHLVQSHLKCTDSSNLLQQRYESLYARMMILFILLFDYIKLSVARLTRNWFLFRVFSALMLAHFVTFPNENTIRYFTAFSSLGTLSQVPFDLSQWNVQFSAVVRTRKRCLLEQALHRFSRLFPAASRVSITRKGLLTAGTARLTVSLLNANFADLFATFGAIAWIYSQVRTIWAGQVGEAFVVARVQPSQLRLHIVGRLVDGEAICIGGPRGSSSPSRLI